MIIYVNMTKLVYLNKIKISLQSFQNAIMSTFNYLIPDNKVNKSHDKNNSIRSPSVLTIKQPFAMISQGNETLSVAIHSLFNHYFLFIMICS